MSGQLYDQYLMTYISDQDDVYYPYFDLGFESVLMISELYPQQVI